MKEHDFLQSNLRVCLNLQRKETKTIIKYSPHELFYKLGPEYYDKLISKCDEKDFEHLMQVISETEKRFLFQNLSEDNLQKVLLYFYDYIQLDDISDEQLSAVLFEMESNYLNVLFKNLSTVSDKIRFIGIMFSQTLMECWLRNEADAQCMFIAFMEELADNASCKNSEELIYDFSAKLMPFTIATLFSKDLRGVFTNRLLNRLTDNHDNLVMVFTEIHRTDDLYNHVIENCDLSTLKVLTLNLWHLYCRASD